MTKIGKFLFAILILVTSAPAYAQEPEMADTMRSEGKIYVVVSIILVIFSGLIAYLILLDRKIGKAEKRLSTKG
jgi:cadmium resistance protein CadD (predicted permease)